MSKLLEITLTFNDKTIYLKGESLTKWITNPTAAYIYLNEQLGKVIAKPYLKKTVANKDASKEWEVLSII